MLITISKVKNETEVRFKVRDSDALHSILALLSKMDRDTSYGHSATYVADEKDDGEFKVGVDGDGAANVSDISIKTPADKNFLKININDYIYRGKYEFAQDKSKHIKDGALVEYKGKQYYVYYTPTRIELYLTQQDFEKGMDRPEHSIRWSYYLNLKRQQQNRLFKLLKAT